jgi:hypothetical protein
MSGCRAVDGPLNRELPAIAAAAFDRCLCFFGRQPLPFDLVLFPFTFVLFPFEFKRPAGIENTPLGAPLTLKRHKLMKPQSLNIHSAINFSFSDKLLYSI